jgi:hypothetical protein
LFIACLFLIKEDSTASADPDEKHKNEEATADEATSSPHLPAFNNSHRRPSVIIFNMLLKHKKTIGIVIIITGLFCLILVSENHHHRIPVHHATKISLL